MRHRIVSGTGLGNPDPVILDNKGEVPKDFADEAIETYFKKWEGFDFAINKDFVMIGIEPSYQYDRMKLVQINRDKSKSFIQQGRAWGCYGSQITKSTKTYGEYKRKSKFVRFVDKWYDVLFKE
jgi:hypothetical protein